MIQPSIYTYLLFTCSLYTNVIQYIFQYIYDISSTSIQNNIWNSTDSYKQRNILKSHKERSWHVLRLSTFKQPHLKTEYKQTRTLTFGTLLWSVWKKIQLFHKLTLMYWSSWSECLQQSIKLITSKDHLLKWSYKLCM